MNGLLGLDRTFLWAMRGLSRLFVRATLVPADARERLKGRARPVQTCRIFMAWRR